MYVFTHSHSFHQQAARRPPAAGCVLHVLPAAFLVVFAHIATTHITTIYIKSTCSRTMCPFSSFFFAIIRTCFHLCVSRRGTPLGEKKCGRGSYIWLSVKFGKREQNTPSAIVSQMSRSYTQYGEVPICGHLSAGRDNNEHFRYLPRAIHKHTNRLHVCIQLCSKHPPTHFFCRNLTSFTPSPIAHH